MNDSPAAERTTVVDAVRALSKDRRALLAIRRSASDPEGAHPEAVALIGEHADRVGSGNRWRAQYLIAALMADDLYQRGHLGAESVYSIGTSISRIRDANLKAVATTIATRGSRDSFLDSLPRLIGLITRSGRIPIPWSSLLRDLELPEWQFDRTQRRWASDIVRRPAPTTEGA